MPLSKMSVSVLSPCHCAMLRKATRRVSQAYDTALAPTGLKTTQYTLLSAINRAGQPTLSELAAILVMDRSTLGHNLRPLDREGLVEMLADPADARSRRVRLTTQGVTRQAEARRLWLKMQDRFEETFGSSQTAALREALLQLATLKFHQA